jgi:hypothetical protein
MKKIKLNKFKLLEQMEKNGLDRNTMSQRMGINKQIFYRKVLHGFSVSEVYHICSVLHVETDVLT